MMVFCPLMMLPQNVSQRRKYQSYNTFHVIVLGYFTGGSAFQNLVFLASCIISSV